jgi:ABC-2 type transport system permease protein
MQTAPNVSRWPAYRAEFYGELLKAVRAPEFAAPTLLLPLLFYGLFGLVLARGMDTPKYLLATYGIFAAVGPALFGFGAAVSLERDQGLLALKQVAPMPPAAYLCAKLLVSLIFVTAVVLGIYVLAALVGGVVLPRSTWLQLAAVHVGATIPFGLLGLVLGLTMRGSASIAVCNIVFLLLAVCGGLWMPLDFFPKWMQQVALALPTYHMAEWALIVTGRNRAHGMAFHVLAMLAFSATFAVLAWLAAKRSAR